jgi:hypothetical protein
MLILALPVLGAGIASEEALLCSRIPIKNIPKLRTLSSYSSMIPGLIAIVNS